MVQFYHIDTNVYVAKKGVNMDIKNDVGLQYKPAIVTKPRTELLTVRINKEDMALFERIRQAYGYSSSNLANYIISEYLSKLNEHDFAEVEKMEQVRELVSKSFNLSEPPTEAYKEYCQISMIKGADAAIEYLTSLEEKRKGNNNDE